MDIKSKTHQFEINWNTQTPIMTRGKARNKNTLKGTLMSCDWINWGVSSAKMVACQFRVDFLAIVEFYISKLNRDKMEV